MTKITINTPVEHDAKFLFAECGVRYWEDGEVNGQADENGDLIPCRIKDDWSPLIEIETGTILGWPEGTTASVHYKICDAGKYTLLDADRKKIVTIDGYVPDIMSPGGRGYGDYVIMTIDGTGKIENWSVDLAAFAEERG